MVKNYSIDFVDPNYELVITLTLGNTSFITKETFGTEPEAEERLTSIKTGLESEVLNLNTRISDINNEIININTALGL
jgi:hypothetical protein